MLIGLKIRRAYINILTFSNVFYLYGARFFVLPTEYLRLWNGAVFKVVNANNNLGTVLEVFYLKEYRDVEELKKISKPTLIDIGANIGTFTVWALKALDGAQIFSYEPESKNYELLVENIRLNGLTKQAKPFNHAVCGSAGERSLAIAGESSGKNSMSVDVGTDVSETVSCVTLNSIFEDNHITKCDCLKVDCEGSEYELFYNASPSTLEKISMIILEHHNVVGETAEELRQFLRSHGFVIEDSKQFASMLTARKKY